jgi:hypothetical protein
MILFRWQQRPRELQARYFSFVRSLYLPWTLFAAGETILALTTGAMPQSGTGGLYSGRMSVIRKFRQRKKLRQKQLVFKAEIDLSPPFCPFQRVTVSCR